MKKMIACAVAAACLGFAGASATQLSTSGAKAPASIKLAQDDTSVTVKRGYGPEGHVKIIKKRRYGAEDGMGGCKTVTVRKTNGDGDTVVRKICRCG